MFLVSDIWDEALTIFGACDETTMFRWIADSVDLVANKGDFDGWKGTLDICTSGDGTMVSLPREVGVVYACNIGGHPTLGKGQLFNFHLNGPGDCTQSCEWSWLDLGGMHPTYQDITVPNKIVAYISSEADNGKKVLLYGYDRNGNKLSRQISGQWQNGYQVPTIYGYAMPDDEAPEVARIIRIVKEPTEGPVRIATIDSDGNEGQLLTVLEPDERFPQYRRIKLGRKSSWVRIAYRRASESFSSRSDHILLRSRLGFLLALQARKSYHEKDYAAAHAAEADAARLELEAQNANESPTYTPIQVIDTNNLQDKRDVDIV
jgi:hypothetical protein